MKRRMLAVLLCVLILFAATSVVAMADESGGSDKPLSISFENPSQSGSNVTVDVKLNNASANSVGATLIDIHLAITGGTYKPNASTNSVTVNDEGSGIVRIYRNDLATPLPVPANGSITLCTLTIEATAASITIAQQSTAEVDGISASGVRSSLLNSVEPFNYTLTNTGVTVSGQVKSYNPNNATTIELKQGATVKYTTTIAAVSGSGLVTQDFSITGVAAGTYDLVVTKAAHLTYTITGVVVGDTNLNLKTNSNAAISTIALLCGDVNGDGRINNMDYALVLDPTNFNKSFSLPSEVGNANADVNGDGRINNMDYALVLDPQYFNKSISACTITY